MVWKEIIETLADDFITYTMTIAVLYMVVTGAIVPEWIVGAYGLILAYYFKGVIMETKDNIKLTGHVNIKQFRKGVLIDERDDHNLIQNIGKTTLAKFITGEFTGNFGWMGIGKTGVGGPDGTLTALVAEVGLDGLTTTVHQAVTSAVVTTYTALIVETFTMSGTAAISEIGLFNQLNLAGSTMLARQTFADLNLVSTDSLMISWSIVVS